jgi:hypothetical protein
MKKTLLFIFLFAQAVYGQVQSGTQFVLQPSIPSAFAASLNGTTQYASLTPVAGSMDLNGSEMITAADDRTFETTKGNWADNGNHSAVRSTIYKHSGNASLLITATAAGDATTNFESLPYSAFTTIVSGNKFTKELWAYGNTNGVTLTMKIGDQVVTGKVIYNAVAGTFAKLVFNFQATSSTVNQPIQLYLSGAGTCNIDDCSLTQAYDAMLVQFTKHSFTSISASERPLSVGNNSTRYMLITGADNLSWSGIINDGTITISGSKTVTGTNDNLLHIMISTFDRCGNVTIYQDAIGGSPTSILTVGKVVISTPCYIGAYANANYWNGLLGETQVIRFSSLPSNIISIIQQISTTKKCLASYPNQISGGIWIDWRTMMDKWGVQGALTNNGGFPIVRVR